MNRKLVWLLTVLLLACVHLAEAQQPKKVHQIGYLSGRGKPGPSNPDSRVGALRQGLRDLGYIEGKDIVIEYRWAEGTMERLPTLATELVRLKVDVIVSLGNQPSQAAKQATALFPLSFQGWEIRVHGGLYRA
jgi:putative ABC transport system substrate-binding protein